MTGGGNAAQFSRLTLRYAGAASPLFWDFDLCVAEGETLALTGESGVGKSTLLRCLCGVVPHAMKAELSGGVLLWGRPVSDYSRAELAQAVGVVFQNPDTQLFCDCLEDELAFGLENLCLPRGEMAARIDEALALTGLEAYRAASPNALSGGQKQLAVLGAVMAMRPRLLLLDEALAMLDDEAARAMIAAFERLKAAGQTIVMVDHDVRNLGLADRVVDIGRARHESA